MEGLVPTESRQSTGIAQENHQGVWTYTSELTQGFSHWRLYTAGRWHPRSNGPQSLLRPVPFSYTPAGGWVPATTHGSWPCGFPRSKVLSGQSVNSQEEYPVLSGHLHITFLGTKPNMSVDPILREDSPETKFKKMIKACICLALYILQSFSTYFISFDLHHHARAWVWLSGIGEVKWFA